MKKVLFVIERLCGGGAERALSNIVTHFPSDWRIDILVDDESLIEYPYRGNILSLSSPEKISTIHFVKNMIKRAFYLKRLKRENGYNACVSFLEGANISNVLSGNGYCKTIVSIRNQLMPEQLGLYYKVRDFLITTILMRQADVIVAVSKEIASGLVEQLKIPANHVQAIVNGYDREWIKDKMRRFSQKEMSEKEFFKGNHKVIVTAGRIAKPKGQWHLIRAFTEVIKKEPQAVLLILGEGPLKGYLTELIHMYDLEGKVILVGRSDNPFWFYANADVFVFPSLWEGYPNALAEAICCGAPCISADVHTGPREILAPELNVTGDRICTISEEEYGILIPVCSGKMYRNCEPLEIEEKKMADAIIMLLSDSKKREYYKEKSIERSKALNINSIVSEWINVILSE